MGLTTILVEALEKQVAVTFSVSVSNVAGRARPHALLFCENVEKPRFSLGNYWE